MNYLVYATALHLEPRPGVALKRFSTLLPEPGAGSPRTARTRRRSLPRVLAALTARRDRGDTPAPAWWPPADSGVSPMAGGTTRGVAFLVDR